MFTDFEKWINNEGLVFFKKLGIKSGQNILDFGCGWGSNTIPVAKAVAPSGYVYALEKNEDYINKLLETADKYEMKNIKVLKSLRKISTSASDRGFDGVLLYDVIHDYYFDRPERKRLFIEMKRIIKKGGLLSVFPHHMSGRQIGEIKKEILCSGFLYRNRIRDKVLHDSVLISGIIYNFIKK